MDGVLSAVCWAGRGFKVLKGDLAEVVRFSSRVCWTALLLRNKGIGSTYPMVIKGHSCNMRVKLI